MDQNGELQNEPTFYSPLIANKDAKNISTRGKYDLPSRWCWIPPNMKMKSGPYSTPYIDQHKNVLTS